MERGFKRSSDMEAAGIQGGGSEVRVELPVYNKKHLDASGEGQARPDVMPFDLFFSRPIERCYSDTDLFELDDFLARAFSNPIIGTNQTLEGNYAGYRQEYFTTASGERRPKQLLDVEVILRDPSIQDRKKRFAPENVVGIRDRRSILDELALPGRYILSQIWDNQCHAGNLSVEKLVDFEYLLYELKRLDVQREIAHPRMRGCTDLKELYKKAISEIKMHKALARTAHKQEAINDCKPLSGPGEHIESKELVMRVIRADIANRHPAKQKSSVKHPSVSSEANVQEYVKRVGLLDPEAAEKLKGEVLSGHYNLDDPECPVNPAVMLDFEHSKRVFKRLCPGIVATSPQFNIDNYIDPKTGVRMYPFPDLVFTVPFGTRSPRDLVCQLLGRAQLECVLSSFEQAKEQQPDTSDNIVKSKRPRPNEQRHVTSGIEHGLDQLHHRARALITRKPKLGMQIMKALRTEAFSRYLSSVNDEMPKNQFLQPYYCTVLFDPSDENMSVYGSHMARMLKHLADSKVVNDHLDVALFIMMNIAQDAFDFKCGRMLLSAIVVAGRPGVRTQYRDAIQSSLPQSAVVGQPNGLLFTDCIIVDPQVLDLSRRTCVITCDTVHGPWSNLNHFMVFWLSRDFHRKDTGVTKVTQDEPFLKCMEARMSSIFFRIWKAVDVGVLPQPDISYFMLALEHGVDAIRKYEVFASNRSLAFVRGERIAATNTVNYACAVNLQSQVFEESHIKKLGADMFCTIPITVHSLSQVWNDLFDMKEARLVHFLGRRKAGFNEDFYKAVYKEAVDEKYFELPSIERVLAQRYDASTNMPAFVVEWDDLMQEYSCAKRDGINLKRSSKPPEVDPNWVAISDVLSSLDANDRSMVRNMLDVMCNARVRTPVLKSLEQISGKLEWDLNWDRTVRWEDRNVLKVEHNPERVLVNTFWLMHNPAVAMFEFLTAHESSNTKVVHTVLGITKLDRPSEFHTFVTAPKRVTHEALITQPVHHGCQAALHGCQAELAAACGGFGHEIARNNTHDEKREDPEEELYRRFLWREFGMREGEHYERGQFLQFPGNREKYRTTRVLQGEATSEWNQNANPSRVNSSGAMHVDVSMMEADEG